MRIGVRRVDAKREGRLQGRKRLAMRSRFTSIVYAPPQYHQVFIARASPYFAVLNTMRVENGTCPDQVGQLPRHKGTSPSIHTSAPPSFWLFQFEREAFSPKLSSNIECVGGILIAQVTSHTQV
eukprot:3390288-Pleurochrysis_carterae.AAC.1